MKKVDFIKTAHKSISVEQANLKKEKMALEVKNF